MLTFQELYETYSPDVYRFAYWLAGNSADAEDIMSETFVRAWIKLDTIRTETLKAYLLTIARNTYLEWARKARLQFPLKDTQPDAQPGSETIAEAHADLEMVRTVLQTLAEIDRIAFVMRVQFDLPYAEIGRSLNLSESAVKVKVHRVRKRLLNLRISKETP